MAKRFQKRRLFRNQPTRNKNCLLRPCLLTDRDKMSNLYRGPSIDASYQVSLHLAKRFQRRRFFRNQPIRNKDCLWWPCLLKDRDKMSNLYRRPSIDAFFLDLLNPSRLTITPLPKNDQLNFYLSKFSLSKNHLYHIWLHLV